MNAELGMIGQRVVYELGFMGREMVGDDVDLASEDWENYDMVR